MGEDFLYKIVVPTLPLIQIIQMSSRHAIPYHTIIPAMVTKNGKLWATFTNMGGFMQPQGHVQVLLNLLNGMDPQAAVDAPRFCVTSNGNIWVEDEKIAIELRQRGHKISVVKNLLERTIVGRAQVIQRRDVLWGGSDHRSDGCVMSSL